MHLGTLDCSFELWVSDAIRRAGLEMLKPRLFSGDAQELGPRARFFGGTVAWPVKVSSFF